MKHELTPEIKPTYVTFEQAKLLKEKGLDVKVDSNFASLNQFFETTIHKTDWNNRSDKFPNKYSAPEQWQVVEWLRIKHGIWIYIYMGGMDFFSFNLQSKGVRNVSIFNSSTMKGEGMFFSPQEAYSAAFDYILTNTI